jgi:hypothetical protein
MSGARRLKGKMTQGDSPDWRPLENLANEEIAGWFMWMFEVALSDGTHVQAYKHRERGGICISTTPAERSSTRSPIDIGRSRCWTLFPG